MKKVNKLVVFSFVLTSAMSLSSCIFNDEKMFEDEKIEEAISLKESEAEMKQASIENVFTITYLDISFPGNQNFPSYSGDYYEYLKNLDNDSFMGGPSGVNYYEPRNSYYECVAMNNVVLTAKKQSNGKYTYGGNYIKEISVLFESEEEVKSYIDKEIDMTLTHYEIFPYSWKLKEAINSLLSSQSFIPINMSAEKTEEQVNTLLKDLQLVSDNGAGYFQIKLNKPFGISMRKDGAYIEFGDIMNPDSSDEATSEEVAGISVMCDYIEFAYQDYLLEHFLLKYDIYVDEEYFGSMLMAEAYKYNVDQTVYVPYRDSKPIEKPEPTPEPSVEPSLDPSLAPSEEESVEPSEEATVEPSEELSEEPTEEPSAE